MSLADQERWDARYRAGAYSDRPHPSAFLQQRWPQLDLPPGARVLDVACGAGRNALYLAALGCEVSAIDGSAVALERARSTSPDLEVQWQVADLEHGLPAGLGLFDLIVMVRYVNATVLQALPTLMRPGGLLLVEQHMQTTAAVGGPGHAAFRVAPGALRAAVPGLQCLVAEEGLIPDPDNKPMALTRLLARLPADLSAPD